MWSAKRAVVYLHGKRSHCKNRAKVPVEVLTNNATIQNKGDLAMEYADARVEAESAHIKRGAQKPFDSMKRDLPSPLAELNSARGLLEYMNG